MIFCNTDRIGEDTDYDKPNIVVLIFSIMDAYGLATNNDVAQMFAILHSVLPNIFKEV